MAETHPHGRLRAAPHATVENEAESRPPEWCQSNFPVPEEQKLPNLRKGHTVSAPAPLQMRFCQRPIVHRLCAWRTAVSPGGSPCRSARRRCLAREQIWGTVRARRVDSRSASHFAHSGGRTVSLFHLVKCVEFSCLVRPVSVLGSSICAGNKEI